MSGEHIGALVEVKFWHPQAKEWREKRRKARWGENGERGGEKEVLFEILANPNPPN
jgi:hypothetical protein